MANLNQIPIPPVSANINDLHKHIIELNNWTKNMFLVGTQATHMNQNELTKIVSVNDLSNAGKIFFNTDESKMQKSTIVSNNLTISDF